MGIFVVGEGLRTLIRAEGARPWRDVSWLAGISAIAGLATAINPRFVTIFGYVLDLMTDKPSQRLIEEWQSPTPGGIANMMFYISILLLLVALAYSRYHPTPTDLLLLIGFLWLAWNGQRYVIWFEIIAMPILAQAFSQLPLKMPTFVPQRNWMNGVLIVLIFIPVVLAQPWFVERVPLPQKYWDMVLRSNPIGPLVDVATPVQATEYLKDHPGGKLYNEMGYGSYLIWALPEQKVFIDPRVELYPYEQWQDYIRINRGVRYNELLVKYGADRILLDKSLQEELSRVLASDPLWREEYEDPHAQIWIRANPPIQKDH
jgi:hypothetical protein